MASDGQSRTVPLDRREQPTRRLALLAYHRHGVEALPLREGSSVVIGRYPPAELVIDDPTLSREHARLSLVDGEVTIEDLGSTNGVRVDGAPTEGQRVDVGARIELGAVIVGLHALGPSVSSPRAVESHERFGERLADELERSRVFARPLSLLLLRPRAGASVDPHRWVPALQQQLRPVDRLGLYGGGAVEVLLPEIDAQGAARVTRTLLDAVAPTPVDCGVAAFPEHAPTAEGLLSAACQAAQLAAGQGLRLSPPASSRTDLAPASAPVAATGGAMERVLETARRVAPAAIPVLIVGETGTGKELVAQLIHREGRPGRPLRSINCGAIPEQLRESALFGHERGAFTGAVKRSLGVFEAAHTGTVFLDEVSELSPAAQAALLRVLESKRLTRVGSHVEVEVDVRVVAATSRDLEAMATQELFRWDLLFRLNTMQLEVPPLRERAEDLEALCTLFLRRAAAANKRQPAALAPAALAALRRHPWPGNVRELRNVIERAVVISEGPSIGLSDLPASIRALARGAPPPADEEPGLSFKQRIRRYERQLIRDAMRACGWNQAAAARRLKIPPRTLSHKIRALALDRAED